MNVPAGPILLVGCGTMGGALLAGWIARDLAVADVAVVEPGEEAAAAARSAHGVTVVSEIEALAADFAPRVVVLAVKPQVMDAVVPPYRRLVGPGTVFLSIAAGKTIGYLARQLGEAAAIVRAMPNTPAAVGRGISVLCANEEACAAQTEDCRALLGAVGDSVVFDEESLL